MLAALLEATATYRVEVSGWDARSEFFVEKAELEWCGEGGKQVLLAHPVERGSLLFLRLLHMDNVERVQPVPYQAGAVTMVRPGRYRVRLVPAHPQLGRR